MRADVSTVTRDATGLPRAPYNRARDTRCTHVYCYVADDCGVVRQPDVFRVVLIIFTLRGARLLLVDDKGALHVDLHIPRMQDRLVDVALCSRAPRPRRYGT